MVKKRLYIFYFLMFLFISGFSDGNEGRKDKSSGKTDDILRKADLIIRKTEVMARKADNKTSKTVPGNLKPSTKSSKPKTYSRKPGSASTVSSRHRTFPSLLIMDFGGKASGKLVRFMLAHNKDLDSGYVSRLIRTYIAECRREGVNHDVAVCQMCLETGFLRFNGSVSRYQNNFCGLGAVNSWSEGDRFISVDEGVRAHIQHLKAYASLDPVKSPVVDKRFENVKRGSVVTIHDLTGKWAADLNYGDKIGNLLNILYSK